MARKCIFCGGTPVTSEHVFRKSYRKRVGVSHYEREFTQRKLGDTLMTARPENPFDCQVKRVCGKCNSRWMNRLDNAVDSWVFDPTNPPTCTVQEFRRWVIKIAILRAMVDQPNAIPGEDCAALFRGEDVPSWRVFVGHTVFAEFLHAYAGTSGTTVPNADGSMNDGLVHVSWVIGNSFACAIRTLGEFGDYQASYFDNYNFDSGWPLAELSPSTADFPAFDLRPKLDWPNQVRSFTWFYTPEPVSPIAHMMQK